MLRITHITKQRIKSFKSLTCRFALILKKLIYPLLSGVHWNFPTSSPWRAIAKIICTGTSLLSTTERTSGVILSFDKTVSSKWLKGFESPKKNFLNPNSSLGLRPSFWAVLQFQKLVFILFPLKGLDRRKLKEDRDDCKRRKLVKYKFWKKCNTAQKKKTSWWTQAEGASLVSKKL